MKPTNWNGQTDLKRTEPEQTGPNETNKLEWTNRPEEDRTWSKRDRMKPTNWNGQTDLKRTEPGANGTE
ncbi:hypothetical protein CesoFtcFv8_005788 [Champsocephalus esox]|uniref:Uncharacterized protein n=1 Tax=Champsocephalus esox TaxID=159716 RepID=A0AAN8CI61_9TELE|nr:hypothetical protein CesoFtcFv8_005788 [Champsocephalus esox]